MTPLVRFLLVNLAGGFALGLLTGAAFIHMSADGDLILGDAIGTGLTLWSFAASFGLGAVGTGLALLPQE